MFVYHTANPTYKPINRRAFLPQTRDHFSLPLSRILAQFKQNKDKTSWKFYKQDTSNLNINLAHAEKILIKISEKDFTTQSGGCNNAYAGWRPVKMSWLKDVWCVSIKNINVFWDKGSNLRLWIKLNLSHFTFSSYRRQNHIFLTHNIILLFGMEVIQMIYYASQLN